VRETPFAELASLGEQLERTTSRLELAGLLAEFLQKLDPAEIPAGVRLTIGQVFPEWDGRALNLSWKAAMKVVGELASPTAADREAIFSEAEDTGEAVRLLLERALRQGSGQARSEPPQPPPLTILAVIEPLRRSPLPQGQVRAREKRSSCGVCCYEPRPWKLSTSSRMCWPRCATEWAKGSCWRPSPRLRGSNPNWSVGPTCFGVTWAR